MTTLASLHTHSWYSLLEGVSAPDALLARAAACGYAAVALTDSNNLYGAAAFVEAAKGRGVRPLLGACLRQHRTRCVALVAEPAGWRGLCRVLSRLHLLGDVLLVDLLRENAEGLHVLADNLPLAERLRDAFGGRLWLEVVRPGRGDRPRRENERREAELLEGGRRMGLRPVASTAAHFAASEEYSAFRTATAAHRGTLLDRLPRAVARHAGPSPRGPGDVAAAVPRLARGAAQPRPPRRTTFVRRVSADDGAASGAAPRGLERQRFLRLLCDRGLRRRGLYGDPAAHERLGEELVIIEAADLAPYFLVVRDLARHARRRGLPTALRGSAGNSLVCYLLEITDVDPLRFGLALDRFLHIGRPDLPDIDLDFDWRVRDEVIAHAFGRYGDEHTAMVSSHLFLRPRSAFREAGKIHGLSNEQITRLAGDPGGEEDEWDHGPGAEVLAAAPPPPSFALEPSRWPRLLGDARCLLGRPHHLSVHCGGVVITPRPIDEYVPLQRAAKGVVVTQFDKDGVEAAGLVKIDLLGNRALANVEETLRLAGGASRPAPLYDDPAALHLLQTGDTLGVNQLESPAMRHLLDPDATAGDRGRGLRLALIRPGAGAVGMKGRYMRGSAGASPCRRCPPASIRCCATPTACSSTRTTPSA